MPRNKGKQAPVDTLTSSEFSLALIEALSSSTVTQAINKAIDYDFLANKVLQKFDDKWNILTKKIKSNEEKVSDLQTKVDKMQAKLDEYEQYSRRDNLRFHGVPETKTDPIEEVIKITNEKMGLKISRNDISRAHRTGPTKKDTPRPILVRFSSYTNRAIIKSTAKKLSGTHIYIAEDLTKHRDHLLFLAREAKRSKKISNCWSFDGRIMIKSNNGIIKTINDVKDLDRITSDVTLDTSL